MEKYLMGIDAGNTSSKVVIFDLYGKMIATAATPSMHFKRRGEGFEEFDVTLKEGEKALKNSMLQSCGILYQYV